MFTLISKAVEDGKHFSWRLAFDRSHEWALLSQLVFQESRKCWDNLEDCEYGIYTSDIKPDQKQSFKNFDLGFSIGILKGFVKKNVPYPSKPKLQMILMDVIKDLSNFWLHNTYENVKSYLE